MNEIVLSLFTGLARLPVALRTEPPLLLMTRKAGRILLLAAGPAGARVAPSSLSRLAFRQPPGPYPGSCARALACAQGTLQVSFSNTTALTLGRAASLIQVGPI